ncbi:hypothetical protein BJX96DRAFT_89292 [Aspergillus floccosus]
MKLWLSCTFHLSSFVLPPCLPLSLSFVLPRSSSLVLPRLPRLSRSPRRSFSRANSFPSPAGSTLLTTPSLPVVFSSTPPFLRAIAVAVSTNSATFSSSLSLIF